jgi:hypothetical protein
MIIKNKKDKICLLTDVAIPSDRNVILKESEKTLKYKNLSIAEAEAEDPIFEVIHKYTK